MAEPLARHSLEALTQLMLRQTELRAALALQQPPSQDGTMRLCLWYSPDRAAEPRERWPSRSTKDSTPAGAAGSVTSWASAHIDQCTSDRAPGEAMALVSRTKPTG